MDHRVTRMSLGPKTEMLSLNRIDKLMQCSKLCRSGKVQTLVASLHLTLSTHQRLEISSLHLK